MSDPLRAGKHYDTYAIGERMVMIDAEDVLDVDLKTGAIRHFSLAEMFKALDLYFASEQARTSPETPKPEKTGVEGNPSPQLARFSKR